MFGRATIRLGIGPHSSLDSMSSLEAISGFKLEIDIVQNIIKDYTHLANSGKTIILCWIVDTQSC